MAIKYVQSYPNYLFFNTVFLQDFFVEVEQSEMIANNIPGAKLIIFEIGLHNFHLLESEKFKKTLESFLSLH